MWPPHSLLQDVEVVGPAGQRSRDGVQCQSQCGGRGQEWRSGIEVIPNVLLTSAATDAGTPPHAAHAHTPHTPTRPPTAQAGSPAGRTGQRRHGGGTQRRRRRLAQRGLPRQVAAGGWVGGSRACCSFVLLSLKHLGDVEAGPGRIFFSTSGIMHLRYNGWSPTGAGGGGGRAGRGRTRRRARARARAAGPPGAAGPGARR